MPRLMGRPTAFQHRIPMIVLRLNASSKFTSSVIIHYNLQSFEQRSWERGTECRPVPKEFVSQGADKVMQRTPPAANE